MCKVDCSIRGFFFFLLFLTLSKICSKAKHASAIISDPWNEVGNDLTRSVFGFNTGKLIFFQESPTKSSPYFFIYVHWAKTSAVTWGSSYEFLVSQISSVSLNSQASQGELKHCHVDLSPRSVTWADMSARLPLTALSAQPCCHSVFKHCSISGWTGNSMSGYYFVSQEARGHCFVCDYSLKQWE